MQSQYLSVYIWLSLQDKLLPLATVIEKQNHKLEKQNRKLEKQNRKYDKLQAKVAVYGRVCVCVWVCVYGRV